MTFLPNSTAVEIRNCLIVNSRLPFHFTLMSVSVLYEGHLSLLS